MKVQTIHRIDIGTSEVELDGDIIRIGSNSYSLESAKNVVKAVNILLKLAKKPAKKVVKKKRRKNAKA